MAYHNRVMKGRAAIYIYIYEERYNLVGESREYSTDCMYENIMQKQIACTRIIKKQIAYTRV